MRRELTFGDEASDTPRRDTEHVTCVLGVTGWKMSGKAVTRHDSSVRDAGVKEVDYYSIARAESVR